MPSTPSSTSPNGILSRISAPDLALLTPHLKRVDLPLRKQLETRRKPIDYIYFLESGLASVVANGGAGRSIEVGLIGREGMTGMAVVMGTDRTPNETFIQMAGTGSRIGASNLRQAFENSRTLQNSCLLYA
jgi:CRP-like cAMP-binding protein